MILLSELLKRINGNNIDCNESNSIYNNNNNHYRTIHKNETNRSSKTEESPLIDNDDNNENKNNISPSLCDGNNVGNNVLSSDNGINASILSFFMKSVCKLLFHLPIVMESYIVLATYILLGSGYNTSMIPSWKLCLVSIAQYYIWSSQSIESMKVCKGFRS